MNKHIRALNMKPGTVDETNRTVEVVWTSGSRVRRWDGRGEFAEVLVVTEEACDLTRLNAGAPLLNTHSSWSLGDVLGVVERAWLKNGKGYATVRFSERPEVDAIWKDVVSGVIRNLSVGYDISGFEEIVDEAGNREIRVTKWEPVEISLVPVPADATAQTRSAETGSGAEIAVETEEDTQDHEQADVPETEQAASEIAAQGTVEPAGADAPTASDDPAPVVESTETVETTSDEQDAGKTAESHAARAASHHAAIVRACITHGLADHAPAFIESGMALEDVTARVAAMSEIRTLCKRAGKAEQADQFIQQNKSLADVRAALLEEMLNEDRAIDTRSRIAPGGNTEPVARSDDRLSPSRIYAQMNQPKRGR